MKASSLTYPRGQTGLHQVDFRTLLRHLLQPQPPKSCVFELKHVMSGAWYQKRKAYIRSGEIVKKAS
jgi:hypothetical protein